MLVGNSNARSLSVVPSWNLFQRGQDDMRMGINHFGITPQPPQPPFTSVPQRHVFETNDESDPRSLRR